MKYDWLQEQREAGMKLLEDVSWVVTPGAISGKKPPSSLRLISGIGCSRLRAAAVEDLLEEKLISLAPRVDFRTSVTDAILSRQKFDMIL